MQLVVITPPDMRPEEHATLEALFEQGLTRLHVRKPECTKEEMREYLTPLLPMYANRLVLHSHYPLAKELHLRGIHITEASKGRGYEKSYQGFQISGAVHNLSEVLTLPAQWQYAFLSPIFPSISKPGYSRPFNWQTLKLTIAQSTTCIYALGGITETTLPKTREAGFSGAAVLGFIWEQPDTAARIRNFIQLKRCIHATTT